MRKESKVAKQTLEASTSAEQLEILSDLSALFAKGNPICESMAEEKTLREHAAPQVNQAPLCIATPTLQAPLELKSGLIHLLPKFRGLMNEDPYQHLKEFHVVCSSMKPERVTEEQIKLRAFPFSLDGAAKEWLFYLPAGSVTSWEEMMRLFLDRYFPSSRVINARRDICGIKQKNFQSRSQVPSSSQQPSSSRSDSSLEDIVKSLALNTQQFQMSTQQFQNETRSSIQSLESQVSKLATSMSKLESQGKLPSQTEMNPRQNVSAITLRSGKKLEELIRKRSCGHDLGAESEPETEIVMMKPIEGVQNEEKSSPHDDVYEGTFSMEFDGEVVKFNAMKRPNEISSVCKVGVVNPIVKEKLELHQQGKLSNMLSESIDQVCLEKPKEDPNSDEVKKRLGDYKKAVAYVKDLSLSICMQRIPLGVNYDHIQEVQRYLDPPRMEVFQNEFQKLLDADMIYLDSDSKWVNQMQFTPNEKGTMVGNSEWVDYVAPKPPENE
ncbi:DNA-directed DNA polymerase [Senna tora]|uniref:DNA-directed DNA polymerase n=1 Tax=Senna tora TaxID=362788 RepID=A0A834X7H8_9FABA|nr:DNA-directed DNA polymerase [Senna tora]